MIYIWCSLTRRKRIIAYHEVSFEIGSRIEVFHEGTLR